ncbi:hypothetical protein IIF27_004793 [Salmonella enterica]|nr:hypothetical protein [Salmonella enterica]
MAAVNTEIWQMLVMRKKAFAKAMAIPVNENGERFIYFEASNEGIDQQGECILASALKDSVDTFLKFGNIDIDHYTQIGAKMGIKDYQAYEVGQPEAVIFEGERTLVKARLYAGDTPMAARADELWASLTQLNPPAKWYPSVGGAILDKHQETDGKTGKTCTIITSVRWTNVGLSRTPVNQHLPTVTAAPEGVFLKLFSASGGNAPVPATGAAFRKQSLDKRKLFASL